MNLIPVIISGGSGSRLWPLSTKEQPKPFVRLFEDGNLLEKTIARIKGLSKQVLFVCNKKHLALHQKVIQKNQLSGHFLLEQDGKNTAPAILMAARFLQKKDLTDAIMLVLPADQFILEQDQFQEAVQKAAAQAQKGGLVTFGIQPRYPETGYGYLCLEQKSETLVGVKKFVEKPDLTKAKEFLQQKNYFWNSGIFCFSVQSLLQAFAEHQPQMLQNSLQCLQKSTQVDNQFFFDPQTFQKFPSISLDYAIMEKHREVFAVKTHFQWSDIGSWYAVAKLFSKDQQGNVLQGKCFGLDNKNTFLLAKNKFFGLLGLENISVIESEQNILIAHNSKLQEVKKIFEYINSIVLEKPILKKLCNEPEILEVSLDCGEQYTFSVAQNCNVINTNLEPTSLFVDKKQIKLQKAEGIFLTKGKQVFFENKSKKTQKWIKIQNNETQE